jgi:hypothetical protein
VGDFDSTTGTHGFIYDDGTFTILDFPGASTTQAFGVNFAGDVVGAISFAGVGGDGGFIYKRGTLAKLDNPAASSPGHFLAKCCGTRGAVRSQLGETFRPATP